MTSLNSFLCNTRNLILKTMELEAQRKDKETEKEVIEEPKTFMMWKMTRGFSLFQEALLVF